MDRIVFAGTPAFALASLKALVDDGRNVVAVYTQPDRPAGRGRKLSASPVKQFAEQQGIQVLQPRSLRDADVIAELAALQPDLLVVAAYGLILPQAVLDIPAHGCINVHASVLPRWRGAAPIQAAILAGDDTTGVSLMRMTAGLDEGPVYCDSLVAIGGEETAAGLHDRLALLGGALLTENLDAIAAGQLDAVAQDETKASYAAKIAKSDAELDWTAPAIELHRRIRAYNPVPGAFFFNKDMRIKVWSALVDPDVNAPAGTILQFDADGFVIACGEGGLRFTELQAPGKRRAAVREFVAQVDIRQ